jgi:hypothetical protein
VTTGRVLRASIIDGRYVLHFRPCRGHKRGRALDFAGAWSTPQ